jgi:hypothetical protein
MPGLVYLLVHRPTRRPYVGATESTLKKRLLNHIREAKRAFRKIDEMHLLMSDALSDWDYAVLETVTDGDKQYLWSRESFWIERLGSLVPLGFNIAQRGNVATGRRNPFFGKHHKSTSIELIRTARIGSKLSDETRRRISKKGLGRKLTPEHSINIGNGRRGKTTKALGVPKASEHARKIALARIGSKLVDGKFVEDNGTYLVSKSTCVECNKVIVFGKKWLHLNPSDGHTARPTTVSTVNWRKLRASALVECKNVLRFEKAPWVKVCRSFNTPNRTTCSECKARLRD